MPANDNFTQSYGNPSAKCSIQISSGTTFSKQEIVYSNTMAIYRAVLANNPGKFTTRMLTMLLNCTIMIKKNFIKLTAMLCLLIASTAINANTGLFFNVSLHELPT